MSDEPFNLTVTDNVPGGKLYVMDREAVPVPLAPDESRLRFTVIVASEALAERVRRAVTDPGTRRALCEADGVASFGSALTGAMGWAHGG